MHVAGLLSARPETGTDLFDNTSLSNGIKLDDRLSNGIKRGVRRLAARATCVHHVIRRR